MDKFLEGKVVIITGIGPGFGRVLAAEASALGAKVSLMSRSPALMEEVAAAIWANGGEVIANTGDVTSKSDCERIAKATIDTFGRIDGLVNSAYKPGDINVCEEIDLDELLQAFNVNVVGALRMVRAVVPYMKTQGRGSIINIGSQVARKIVLNQGGYSATKAALAALTRQLASELGPHGIRVNTPAFGWTISPPARAWLERQEREGGPTVEASIDAVAQNLALRRVPDEVECSRAALLFLTDHMAIVTGATLDINGGDYMAL